MPRQWRRRERGLSPKGKAIIGWNLQVARDGDLPGRARSLALILTAHLWPHPDRAGAFYLVKPQSFFVNELGLARSTIQNAFGDLVKGGHLSVEVRKEQGAPNRYVLELRPEEAPQPAQPVETAAPIVTEETVRALTLVHAEEIEALRTLPAGSPGLFQARDIFEAVQAAFPPDKRAPLDGEAHAEFLEMVSIGEDPVDLFRDACREIRRAQDEGQESPSAAEWCRRSLAFLNFD